MMNKQKVVLAFSGGLDTSYCAVYLAQEKGLDVHTVLVNTGGFMDEELEKTNERALSLGVASHTNIDKTDEFYQKGVKYLLFGNVLKNNTYPLSVSAERVFQAMAIADYASKIKAGAIAHGSTGAGNDQVRFDLIFNVLAPDAEIITPIRDQQLSREEEVEYLKAHGVNAAWGKAKYSVNKGLWGTSVGGAETLTSDQPLPEEAWPTPFGEDDPLTIDITFKRGEPVALNGEKLDPITLIKQLNDVAAPYGIGRDIHVGDTIIGIKGRVGFEAAAPVILIKAHHLLEKHILSKWQLQWKQQMADLYGMLMHEGQYLDPVMRDIEAFLESTQQFVTGKVTLTLFPYRFELHGIESEFDQMASGFGHYGEMNTGWSGEDVKGFTKILANQTKILNSVQKND